MIRIAQAAGGLSLPLVFDSPHSGNLYPDDFDFALDPMTLRRSEDAYVEDLFANVTGVGGALLQAEFPRCYIDPNRAPDDIDPSMIDGDWPHAANPSDKASRGAGLIWRHVKRYGQIYDRLLSVDEVQRRIDTCWRPYHAALQALLNEAYTRFGTVVHVNCHSMASMGDNTTEDGWVQRPDFILGDLDGQSCDPIVTTTVRQTLEAAGYSVVLNYPYKGQELIRRYSDPGNGRHSLQIEVSRALYMDEASIARRDGYRELRDTLTHLAGELASLARRLATRDAND